MMGDKHRINWKCLMFGVAVRPKAYFFIWIMLHQRLTTAMDFPSKVLNEVANEVYYYMGIPGGVL